MPAIYKTEGLILRRRLIRDADRLITVLTPHYGKLELLARGAAKIKSKLAAHLEPFSDSQLMIAVGKNYDQLVGSTVKKSFTSFSRSIIKKAWADYTIEITDRLIKTHQADAVVYELLSETWLILDQLTLKSAKDYISGYIIIAGFILKLLTHLGYRPGLNQCELCNQTIGPKGNFYDFTRGSVVCQRCHLKIISRRNLIPISASAIKILRFLINEPWARIKKLVVPTTHLNELKKIIDRFLAYYIEGSLNTVKFIQYFNRSK